MPVNKTHALTDEVLESMRQEVDEFFATHEKIPTSIEYEEKVLEVARKFAERLLAGGLGQLPKDRNAKKKS